MQISDKLILRIKRNLIKRKNPTGNGQKIWKSQFTEEYTEVANKHMKRYLIPLLIGKHIIKAMGYHFTFIMMAGR